MLVYLQQRIGELDQRNEQDDPRRYNLGEGGAGGMHDAVHFLSNATDEIIPTLRDVKSRLKDLESCHGKKNNEERKPTLIERKGYDKLTKLEGDDEGKWLTWRKRR